MIVEEDIFRLKKNKLTGFFLFLETGNCLMPIGFLTLFLQFFFSKNERVAEGRDFILVKETNFSRVYFI